MLVCWLVSSGYCFIGAGSESGGRGGEGRRGEESGGKVGRRGEEVEGGCVGEGSEGQRREGEGRGGKGRVGEGREGNGREGKGRRGKGSDKEYVEGYVRMCILCAHLFVCVCTAINTNVCAIVWLFMCLYDCVHVLLTHVLYGTNEVGEPSAMVMNPPPR